MTTIILADSDETVLGELLDSLQSVRPDWQFVGLSRGIDVLQRANTENDNCIVTDVDLPDMSGFELLSKLQANYPDIVRITLTHDLEQRAELEISRLTHRFINRAVCTDTLVSAIESSLRLQQLLCAEPLKRSMSDIGSLPSLPEIYQEMISELTSPQSSLSNVAKIIESDSALTATVLKIVNSAFYGLNQRIESVSQGVALLGVHLIKNITLTAKVFAQFDGGVQQLDKLRRLNDNANRNGALTNQMARLAGLARPDVDHAQIAGMLSNIGEVFSLSDKTNARTDQAEAIATELQGAYLLKLWLLPEPVIEAVALQYESTLRPSTATTPLTILHAIRYLETHYVDPTNKSQREDGIAYLEKRVSPGVAEQWVDAYCDVMALTAQNDIDRSRVA
ncbi:MAG: HDOD domain-containing protein [Granulosicoccus sp.]